MNGLKSLRRRLEDAQRKKGLRFEVLQQDYLLSWILYGLSKHPYLHEKIVFKGGTALKKCYFGEYRFSEDLDFSTIENLPKGLCTRQFSGF